MNEHAWTRRWTRASVVALAMALVVSGLGPDAAGTASAGDRIGKQEVQTFQNATPIAIPSNAQAAPSSIQVTGFDTPVADVEVTLNILTHSSASDLDILLVGPGGQTALIMSDAGGAAADDSPTFDDQAANQVPSSDPLVSGPVQPTNYDFTPAPDTFSAPAPTNPSSGSALAIFNGTNANGAWTLFIKEQDNIPVETGTLGGGWSLTITTRNGVPTAGGDSFQATAGQALNVPADGVLGNDFDPDGDLLQAIVAGQPRQGSLALQPDGGFTYTPKKKAKGTDSFTYLAEDPSGLNALATVDIQIKAKKDKKKGKGKKKGKK